MLRTKVETEKSIVLKGDMINHPKHYNRGIEAIDYIESHGMDFNEGNVVKYITRYKDKNGLEDLKKAKWYLDRVIRNYEKVAAK